MVDWTNVKRYRIQDVEPQIHLIGVKAPMLPYMVFSFIIGVWINPLCFFVGPSILVFIARKFWAAEQRGKPIEYERWFYEKFSRYQMVNEIFKCLPFLQHSQSNYR